MKALATDLRNPSLAEIGESLRDGKTKVKERADARLSASAELQQGGALADTQTPRDAAADWRLADLIEAEMLGITHHQTHNEGHTKTRERSQP